MDQFLVEKKKFSCNDCKKQFVENPSNRTKENEEWAVVDRLLLEKIPISALSRATDSSRTWLRRYTDLKKEFVSNIPFRLPAKEKTDIEAGELWSFVGSKKNGAWIWLALEKLKICNSLFLILFSTAMNAFYFIDH